MNGNSNSSNPCLRCGRSGHHHDDCYAKTDIYGKEVTCKESAVECPRKRRRISPLGESCSPTLMIYEDGHPSNRAIFSSILKSISDPKTIKRGVYVLKLEDGKYYVGSSEYIESRVQAHFVGHGSAWTKMHKPVERITLLTSPMTHLESWERLEFLNRVLCHGIENVRGWAYSSTFLSVDELYNLLQDIAEAKNLCRRCYRDTHFICNCKETTYAQWVGGTSFG